MLGVIYMNINNELFIDIKNFLNHPWSITTKDLEQYDAEINQAAKAVTELRNTGKGPDGRLVLFPNLPYLLEENVLISEEEKNALLSLKKKLNPMMQSFLLASVVLIWEIRCFLIYSADLTGISLLKKREMAILSSTLQDKMWIQSPL